MALDPEEKILADVFGGAIDPAGVAEAQPVREIGDTLRARIPIERWDHELIRDLVPEGSSVLDLGCGRGTLLSCLVRSKKVRGQGVEINPERGAECVRAGVPVIQADLDDGILGYFPDDAFDFVILEKTLQTVKQPVSVVREMLRIGHAGIVSFPNFGHWPVRGALVTEGRAPVTRSLPYEWHNTPNIRMLTIRDFEEFCEKNEVHVLSRWVFEGGRYRPLRARDNLLAEEALYVICDKDKKDRARFTEPQ
ncbi:MAG: methionine biosynthesis protein MetW [Deltaproteobacteria bacterium]|nr:methionine biosynthesis protein MetW [Deltaproteobacteria bacterium]